MSYRDECSSVHPCSHLAVYMSHFVLPTMRLGAMAADVISCRKQLGLPVLTSHFLLSFVPAITSRWRDVAYLAWQSSLARLSLASHACSVDLYTGYLMLWRRYCR